MPRTCTICNHEKRAEIDQALVNNEPLRNIAERYGTTPQTLLRHKKSHLSKAIVQAKQAETIIQADKLLDEMSRIIRDTRDIYDRARKNHDDELALKAVKEMRENNKLLLIAQGDIPAGPVITVEVVSERENLLLEIIMEAIRSEADPETTQRIIGRIQSRSASLPAPQPVGPAQ